MSTFPNDADLAVALCRTHMPPLEVIPDAKDPRNRVAACYECQRRAEALAPLVAARVAAARAEAVEDAADDLERLVDAQHPAAVNPDQWLRDRAAREAEGGDR